MGLACVEVLVGFHFSPFFFYFLYFILVIMLIGWDSI